LRDRRPRLTVSYMRPSHSTIVAYLALFAALGGTTYAATQLPRNSVGPRQLQPGAVSSSKVADHSLTAADFKAASLPVGPAGPRGATGLAGHDGATGAAGPAGPAGATGPAGPAGTFDTSDFVRGPVSVRPLSISVVSGTTQTVTVLRDANHAPVAGLDIACNGTPTTMTDRIVTSHTSTATVFTSFVGAGTTAAVLGPDMGGDQRSTSSLLPAMHITYEVVSGANAATVDTYAASGTISPAGTCTVAGSVLSSNRLP
jgi:Collagen triple helix repeat (20 copies)